MHASSPDRLSRQDVALNASGLSPAAVSSAQRLLEHLLGALAQRLYEDTPAALLELDESLRPLAQNLVKRLDRDEFEAAHTYEKIIAIAGSD